MKYKVKYTKHAVKALEKLDKPTKALIYGWITKNLNGCENPREYGKPLLGDKKGAWRYRIGDYRLIADVQDEVITILILDAGHRREIYKR